MWVKKHKSLFFLIVLGVIVIGVFQWLHGPSACPVCGKTHVIHSFVETVGLPESERITYDLLLRYFGEPIDVEYSCEQQKEDYYKSIMTVKYDKLSFKFYTHEKDTVAPPSDAIWNFLSITTYDPSHVFEHGIHVGCSRRRVLWAFRNALPVSGAEVSTEYWDHGELENVFFTYDENNRVQSIEHFTW